MDGTGQNGWSCLPSSGQGRRAQGRAGGPLLAEARPCCGGGPVLCSPPLPCLPMRLWASLEGTRPGTGHRDQTQLSWHHQGNQGPSDAGMSPEGRGWGLGPFSLHMSGTGIPDSGSPEPKGFSVPVSGHCVSPGTCFTSCLPTPGGPAPSKGPQYHVYAQGTDSVPCPQWVRPGPCHALRPHLALQGPLYPGQAWPV